MKALFEIADICSEKCPKNEEIDESELLGGILLNKVVGISFDKCIKAPEYTFTKEFIDTLECIYHNNVESNKRFLNGVKYLSGILKEQDIPYALLKGAFLIGDLYPMGYRTSNDVDILINEENISDIQKYDGGSRLGRECGDSLKADIVQMAHHGQNGVGRSIYQSIAPKICLWPTPQWLWDNDNGGGYNSGPWKTVETRGWMNEILKVDKNYCIKDGDIVLQLD